LVLCDTYKPDGTPLSNNYRPQAEKIFNEYYLEQPWYGLEQEYFIINPNTNLPLGFRGFETNPNSDSFTQPQGQYYCSVGAGNAFGRKLVNLHYEYCLKMGLGISGINAEVAPGQWEFQIGPVEGIEAADQLMIARYVLIRLAEDFDLKITFHPKPLSGDWNGSGCHTNFSTYKMRSENGLDVIQSAIEKLSKKHDEHMKVYGTDNNLRMSGEHETAKFDEFSYGVANRGASVRIPNEIYKNKKGYFEDRRPSANCDPYLVCSKILETCCESDSDSENNE
jgi:glutamine synthetase